MLPKIYERVKIPIGRQVEGMTDERRSALLVVAALLVTVTYQAVITPPGAFGKMITSNTIPQMYSAVAQMICSN